VIGNGWMQGSVKLDAGRIVLRPFDGSRQTFQAHRLQDNYLAFLNGQAAARNPATMA